MKKIFFFIFFIPFFLQSQTLTGIIVDSLNNPLQNANVIARAVKNKNIDLVFAISNSKGKYILNLDSSIEYQITVSYIGYLDKVVNLKSNNSLSEYNFILIPSQENLEEITISYKYEPLVVKKDTIIYDIKAFISGNERKLKEVLSKLPSVEVLENGSITVQGKKVTKLLVENKLFFGGGTKLAVENIPAHVIKKIEVIDNFNEVDFLKEVSSSKDLAINIKLKDDKKKFIFGDVNTSIGIDNYYLAHLGLFYYTKNTNFSFIGDINNIGQSTFSFQDLIRFKGGISSFISQRESTINLFSFTVDNRDYKSKKNQFSAFNFNHEFNEKLDVTFFGIFSNYFSSSQKNTEINYFQTNTIESQEIQNENKNLLGLANLKLNYTPNKREKWFYNFEFQLAKNDLINFIKTESAINNNSFEILKESDNNSIKQYLEWHQSYSKKHKSTFVINQISEKSSPDRFWTSQQDFLTNFITLDDDESYKINQIKKVKNNSIDFLFKHYWIINGFGHLYTSIGNNYGNAILNSEEFQVLSNGSINNFEDNGFGNQLDSKLNDAFAGIEYKFKIKKLTSTLGLFIHQYNLKTIQKGEKYIISKTLIEPQLDAKYNFNKNEQLKLSYIFSNNFPQANALSNRFTIENYNSIFKGNALLQNEQYHASELSYDKYASYKKMSIYLSASFNKKVKTIRNTIQLQGINQFSTPILSNNPEINWNLYGELSKKIQNFRFNLDTKFSWFDYTQVLNNIEENNQRNSQNIGLSIKTEFKEWPYFKLKYVKQFNKLNGTSNSSYKTDRFSAKLDYTIFKNFAIEADYNWYKNSTNFSKNSYFKIANASVSYQKENSPFRIEVLSNNIFNLTFKNTNSFSDYLIYNENVFILPRITMLSLNYKF